MSAMGIEKSWLEFLRALYDNSTVSAGLGGAKSDIFRQKKGLRQGCPASTTMFNIYIEKIAKEVAESKFGFEITRTNGEHTESIKPCILLYADDMILLANDIEEMQKMLDISSQKANELGLSFNEKKCSVVVFSGEHPEKLVKIQDKTVGYANGYRYLGVQLSNGENIFEEEERIKREKGKQGEQAVRMKSLWSCNRFLVTREIWKSIWVPAITYGNAIMNLSAATMNMLDRTQRAVGRHAMQCRFTCASQFVDGEFGVSSFWAREAQAKLSYESRLRILSNSEGVQNWAAQIYRMKEQSGTDWSKTKWDRRISFLRRKFNVEVELEGWSKEDLKDLAGVVREQVRIKAEETWWGEMNRKSSLDVYRAFKKEHGLKICIYGNTKASGLLADARAGMLNTKVNRAKFEEEGTEGTDFLCGLCGKDEETIKHIILECPELGVRETTIDTALGFNETPEWDEINETKARLSRWANV